MGLLLASPTPAEAHIEPPKPDLRELSISIAEEYEISTTTLYNLLESESRFNPQAESETNDWGIAQLNLDANPDITKEQALDPEWAMRYTASELKKGHAERWSVCNCYSYTKAIVGKLPRMALIAPNAPPSVGTIAIYSFKGVKHLAVVTGISEKGFTWRDANRKPCLTQSGFTNWNDSNLKGFFKVE